MAIPTYDKLFHPILELATRGPITRSGMAEAMIAHFQLSPEEASARLPSGGLTIRNRVGWAMTFLTKAGLIEKTAPKTYLATAFGREFLAGRPYPIRIADLQAIPGFEEAWGDGKSASRGPNTTEAAQLAEKETTATPEEVIDQSFATLQAGLRDRLLQAILNQTPEFFEELVLDVLLAMGYGGSRADAAKHLGRSGDEGIDGVINQDTLGLDQIMVQAKRYKPDSVIDRKTIQAFIGSLAGQGVTKGVFITTSSYAESAREFVLRGSTTKVVLVDGAMLIDLMIQHKIGVRVARTYLVHEIDQNYFDEGE